jgi:uncharacterized protein DUF2017
LIRVAIEPAAGAYHQLVSRHGIARTRDGDFRVRLSEHERNLLRTLPGQLRSVLALDDPSLVRLFPPAYEDDAANAEYRGLVREGLVDGKLAALHELERTATADRLDEDELGAWLGALESLRLALGTQLDVTEDTYTRFDPEGPQAAELAVYGWLSWLQEEVVHALATSLPGD